jgi:uncharacterized protein (DUF608 family)
VNLVFELADVSGLYYRAMLNGEYFAFISRTQLDDYSVKLASQPHGILFATFEEAKQFVREQAQNA